METSFVDKAILVRVVSEKTQVEMAEPRRTGFYMNPNLKIPLDLYIVVGVLLYL